MATSHESDTFHMFCAVAERLNEPVAGFTTVAAASAAAPNSAVVWNILHKLQSMCVRDAKAQHQLLRAEGGQVVLKVHHMKSLTSEQLSSLRQISTRINQVRFVFRAPDTTDTLGYGSMLFTIAETPVEELHMLYAAPLQRQQMLAAPDWRNSVVRSNDRALVIAVVDDVFNMGEFMPTSMRYSLEPIEDVDYKARTKKRGAAVASETDDESLALNGNVVGYALHFTDVPSFDDSFIAFMQHKYDERWIGFALVFPHLRPVRGDELLAVPQRLVVQISAETALLGGAKAHATKGARRLARKVQAAAT
jgi:hypothetical protein